VVYFLGLGPFLHNFGAIYLLFQSSTAILNALQLGVLITGNRKAYFDRLLIFLHPLAFIGVRVLIGLPMGLRFMYQMVALLQSGEARSVPQILFFMVANVAINFLNVNWAIGMALGTHNGNPCCSEMTDDGKGVEVTDEKGNVTVMKKRRQARWFETIFSVSFGERSVPHVGVRQRHATKTLDSSKSTADDLPQFSIPVALCCFSAMIAKTIESGEGGGNPAFLIAETLKSVSLIDVFQLAASFLPHVETLTKTFAIGTAICVGVKTLQVTGMLKILYPETTTGEHLYTRIRGQWYDLAKFDHPGGPVALNLIRGRDGTALFYSHHYLIDFKRLNAILNKYKVSPELQKSLKTLDSRDDHVDGEVFKWETYETDPFTLAVKQMVIDHFTPIAKKKGCNLREASKASWNRTVMVLSLMAIFFGTLPYYIAGSWICLITTPLLAWITSVNYWHDALHFSLSSDWRINAVAPYLFPYLSSPWMWYHQHVIGHHAYTNVSHLDPDLAHAPQLMREHESVKWKKVHAKQHGWATFGFVWTVAVGAGLQILSDIRANTKGAYNNAVPYGALSKPRLAMHVLGRLIYIWCMFIWPYFSFSFGKAFVFASVPTTIYSWCFMINSQINHLNERTAHTSSTHFLKHQVITAQDFGPQNKICEFLSGGLNMQIEHHMFPCVNHCHLKALQPKVEALCKEHGVDYWAVDGYKEAFRMHCEHTEAMGLRPFSEGHEH
jgi:fatty acid desaturase